VRARSPEKRSLFEERKTKDRARSGSIDPAPRRRIVATLVSMLSAFACAEAAVPERDAAPHVLLITVDTLRADRTSPYGDRSSRTPTMARLAAEGTLFENAMSPMQMTRPSHDSLFTSLYPRDHGVVNNKIALGAGFTSMSEVLREAGHATAAFTAVKLLAPGSGLERGFDHFDPPREARTRPANEVVDAAIAWLRERPADRPFFVWVHLFDPHTPYAPPKAFLPEPTHGPGGRLESASIEDLIAVAGEHGGDLPREAVQRAEALYRGDIEYADAELGRLLAHLEDDGTLARTAIAFTADHGECFENGIYFEHSDCLYEGSARIPLIFRWPGHVAANVRRDEVVEILDVAPTLLALSGIERPEQFIGRDLFDPNSLPRDAAYLQHPLYSNRGAKNRSVRRLGRVMGEPTRPLIVSEELLGLRTRDWKYLRHGESEELFDLKRDPGEHQDVANAHPDVVARLRDRLEDWSRAHPQHHAQVELINDEMRATLEALGYIH